MKLQKVVTILIATFNSGKTLRRCLESVLSLNFFQWECILIDGVSKDDTLDIIREYEQKDNRFRHISEKDKGIYDALNKGIRLSKGKWIYVLGSDDWLTSDGLSSLLVKDCDRFDAVYGNIIVAYNNKQERIIYPKRLELIKYYMPISHQGIIIRSDAINKIGGFDLRYICKGDFNMIQTLYISGARFKYVDANIAYCTMGGLSNKLSSIIKYDWERYLINTRNHSNNIPFLSWCWIEFKTIAITVRDKILRRK